MNITDNHQQHVIDHAKKLHELASEETPPLIRWKEIAQYLDEAATFFELFTIPKITIDPRYSGVGPKVAELVIPERPDLEVRVDDSAASLVRDDDPTRRFLAQGNGKA